MAAKKTKSATTANAGGDNGNNNQAAGAGAAPGGAPAGDKAAAKAAAERAAAGDKFTRNFKDGKPVDKKMPPQAKAICNIVEAAGEGGITREKLVSSMKGVVQTRQPESRILTYYTKLLTEGADAPLGLVKNTGAAQAAA